jgi:hypothetical protein
MDAALKAMSSAHSGQVGDAVLNRAADDFQHTWHYGLGQLQQMIKETSEGVNKTHDAYKQCDDAVGQAMQKINGEAMGGIDSAVSAATVRGAAAAK